MLNQVIKPLKWSSRAPSRYRLRKYKTHDERLAYLTRQIQNETGYTFLSFLSFICQGSINCFNFKYTTFQLIRKGCLTKR